MDLQYKEKQPPELIRHRKKYIVIHIWRDETPLGHAYHVIGKLQREATGKHPHTTF